MADGAHRRGHAMAQLSGGVARRPPMYRALPYHSKALPPEVFAERAVMLLESQSTGVSCLDDDILPLGNTEEALDDIFV